LMKTLARLSEGVGGGGERKGEYLSVTHVAIFCIHV